MVTENLRKKPTSKEVRRAARISGAMLGGLMTLGIATGSAAAEEIVFDDLELNFETETTYVVGDSANPALAVIGPQYGLVFGVDGTWTSFYQGVVTVQIFGEGWGVTWQFSGTLIFPDESRIFIRGEGTSSITGTGTGTVEAVGGTGPYEAATGTGQIQIFNPGGDPEGFPDYGRVTWEGFVVTY